MLRPILVLFFGLFAFNATAAEISLEPDRWHLMSLASNAISEDLPPLFDALTAEDVDSPFLWAYDGSLYVDLLTASATDLEHLTAGMAFWYKHSSDSPVVLESMAFPFNDTSVTCAPDVECIRSELRSVGWHMIGNPFDAPLVARDSIMFNHAELCPQGCPITEAIDKGLITGDLWAWSGSEYINRLNDVVVPWEGLWVETLLANVNWFWSNPYCPVVDTGTG